MDANQYVLEYLQHTPQGKQLAKKVNSGEMTIQEAFYEAMKEEKEEERTLKNVAAFATKIIKNE